MGEMSQLQQNFLLKEAHHFGEKLRGVEGLNAIRYVQNDSFWKVSPSPLSLSHVHYNVLPVFDVPYLLTPEARREFTEEELRGPREEMARLFTPGRRIYIIEGVNGCGKDSVLAKLNDKIIDTVELRSHGYYLSLGRKGTRDPQELMAYNKRRVETLLSVMRSCPKDDFILSRLHISDLVFSDLLFGQTNDYQDVEKQLDDLGATLVLLDIPNRDILLERLKGRFVERAVMDANVSPHMCKDTIWDTRRKYVEHFNSSRMKRKLLIDTVQMNLEEEVEEIMKW
jgi:thymidylate kinase